jgi:hypothetical protein
MSSQEKYKTRQVESLPIFEDYTASFGESGSGIKVFFAKLVNPILSLFDFVRPPVSRSVISVDSLDILRMLHHLSIDSNQGRQ